MLCWMLAFLFSTRFPLDLRFEEEVEIRPKQVGAEEEEGERGRMLWRVVDGS